MPKSETKQSVYNALRHSITNLLYKPGLELDINMLAAQMGVSRSPVRDALLKLSDDKLVDIFPQKGTRVSLLNKEIIRQERFMRISLELGVLAGNDHRIRILSYSANKIPQMVETEHEQLIQAISENNTQKIIETEKTHLSRLYEEIPELEKEFPEYFEK